MLEAILRAVHARASELHVTNVTHWELVTLRDADSSKDALFHNSDVLRDDDPPNPAWDRPIRLVAEPR